MTFLAIRQMMSKYFDFIGVGRSELIKKNSAVEKDSAVEKAATNEGCSSSRAIKKDEDDGQNGGQNGGTGCLNDTYYFSTTGKLCVGSIYPFS